MSDNRNKGDKEKKQVIQVIEELKKSEVRYRSLTEESRFNLQVVTGYYFNLC